jgi:hypothetical protein
MTYTYEEITDPILNTKVIKATDEDGKEFWIPTDPSNSDYQAYLNPVEHLTEIPTE